MHFSFPRFSMIFHDAGNPVKPRKSQIGCALALTNFSFCQSRIRPAKISNVRRRGKFSLDKLSGEWKLSKMSGEEIAKVFFFAGHKCPAESQNVRRGINGSPVKMSGEAQNHFTYSVKEVDLWSAKFSIPPPPQDFKWNSP